MTLLNTINIGGTDFGIMNSTVVGVSATPAGSEIKEATFTDGFELKAGNVVTVKFTYANTYGDGSTTYPKLTVAGVTGAIRSSNGSYATTGAWGNQALVPFLYDGVDFTILYNTVVNEVTANNMNSVTSNAVAQRFNSLSYANVPILNHGDRIYLYKFGKVVFMSLSSNWTDLNAGETQALATIPQGFRPITPVRIRESSLTPVTLFIETSGNVWCYNYGDAITIETNGWYYSCWVTEE